MRPLFFFWGLIYFADMQKRIDKANYIMKDFYLTKKKTDAQHSSINPSKPPGRTQVRSTN